MKVLHNYADNREHYVGLISEIQRAAKIATSQHDYLVPRGWQLIVKMKGGERTYFHLHLTEGTGGSYAEAKMATLENFPEQPYTGDDGIADIKYMLEALGFKDAAEPIGIYSAESPEQFTKAQREWLRDNCKIASMYGGIRIQYEFLVNSDKATEPQINTGEILIAFSGASQEQDVFFTVWILSTIQQYLKDAERNTQHSYDLSMLQKAPVINLWLKLMHISEYDR